MGKQMSGSSSSLPSYSIYTNLLQNDVCTSPRPVFILKFIQSQRSELYVFLSLRFVGCNQFLHTQKNMKSAIEYFFVSNVGVGTLRSVICDLRFPIPHPMSAFCSAFRSFLSEMTQFNEIQTILLDLVFD